MMTLFNDEYILKTYVESKIRDATEKIERAAAQKLFQKGNSVEDIADILEVSVKDIEIWLGLKTV